MRLSFLVLAVVLTTTLSIASAACGTFKFTNNLKENLYIQTTASDEDSCHGSIPTMISPGQTVDFPIQKSLDGVRINITTDPSQPKIAADYFLLLHYFKIGSFSLYNFNDEVNTGPFSWSYNRQALSFCTEGQFKKAAGSCTLLKAD